jgi:hypothetical protein
MRTTCSAIFLVVLCAVAGPPAFASADILTDANLVARASALFTNKDSPADRILGIHHGKQVILDVLCGDICPANTVRIIHYLAPPDSACVQSGADVVSLQVAGGIAASQQSFCVPHILVAHKLYTDRPYRK